MCVCLLFIIDSGSFPRSPTTNLCSYFDVVGNVSPVALDETSSVSLQRMSTAVGLEIPYPKILLRGQLFVSKAGSRSNSSTVTYSDPTYCDKVCFGVIDDPASTNVDSCILALFSIKWIFQKKLTLLCP